MGSDGCKRKCPSPCQRTPTCYSVGVKLRLLCLIAALGLPALADAPRVHLQGDRLTLRADGASLRSVLEAFAQAGIRVRADPEATKTITARYESAEVESALKKLLDPLSYALVWDVLSGPLGTVPRLAEIQVFQDGGRGRMQVVSSASARAAEGPARPGGTAWVRDELILGFREGTTRSKAEKLLSQFGATLVESIAGLGAYRVRLPPGSDVHAIAEQLRKSQLVAIAEPNWLAKAPGPKLLTPGAVSTSATDTPRDAASGGRVAVLDSGLSRLPALDPLLAGRLDALQPDRPLTDPAGHGTQMALVAAGLVAPMGASARDERLSLVAVRVFDEDGLSPMFTLLRGLDFAVSSGARVINLSWSTDEASSFLSTALSVALKKDIIVVAAAGNDGKTEKLYPASLPGVLAVGALDETGRIWPQSNRGEHVVLAAPGVAGFPVGYRGAPGVYAGTSIASAYVSHVLGIWRSQHPDATSAQTLEALRAATGAGGSSSTFTWGRLDAGATKKFLE